jgi:hypothetical protein
MKMRDFVCGSGCHNLTVQAGSDLLRSPHQPCCNNPTGLLSEKDEFLLLRALFGADEPAFIVFLERDRGAERSKRSAVLRARVLRQAQNRYHAVELVGRQHERANEEPIHDDVLQ